LVGKLELNTKLGRPMSRWDDKIKVILKGIGWETDWMYLAEDRN